MARIAELLGTPLFPAQRYVYDVALEVQSPEAGDPFPGEWAYDEVLDLEPRRAGKTFKIGPLVAHRCGSAGGRSAWITAQKRTSAVRRWNAVRLQLMAQASPVRSALRARVGKGDEELMWPAMGSSFLPFAPNEDGIHGEDPDLVFVDELWAHDLVAKSRIEQGYKPAWSVKPGQAWLLSAAGTEKSEWLNLAAAKGVAAVRAGKRLHVALFDWGVPDEVGGIAVEELPDADLLEVVVECHPRRDNGLRLPYLVEQLADMGRVDFLRAYGNRTARKDAKTVIDMTAFNRAFNRARIPRTARVGLAFEVDPDSREGAVSAAWRNASGVALTELLKRGDGTRWLAKYIQGVVARQKPGAVAVNNIGPARDVADELERLGVELLRIPAADYAAACRRVSDEMTAPRPTVTHRGEEQVTTAMKASGKRRLAGGFAWAMRGEEPNTAWVSHTLAVWAVDHMPVAPTFRIR